MSTPPPPPRGRPPVRSGARLWCLAALLAALIGLLGCGTAEETSTAAETTTATPTTTSEPVAAHGPTTTATGPGDDELDPEPAPVSDELAVAFLDVGQGDATLLRSPDATILVDAARHDRDDLVPLLRERVVERVDVVILTHAHADHIGQLDRVLGEFEVGEVWMSGTPHTTRTFERALDAVEASGVAYEEPRVGDRTAIGPLWIEVLHPETLTGDLHADSLITRITYGEISFLFTGDAERETEAELLSRDAALMAATVYQVGHHGSSTSTTAELLAAVGPEVAVYSAGADNQYGHPHDEVVDRIIEAEVELYGTDVHGTITVTTDGLTWSVSTERDEPPVSDPGGPSGRDPPATTAPPTITTEPTTTTTPTTAEPSTDCEPGQVDVNTATFDELQRILHIGPDRAQQIVELRPFGSVDAMTQISGIADARLRDIKQEGVACAS